MVYWASDINHYPGNVNVAQFVGMLEVFVAAYPGSVSAIEGPNEVNFQRAEYNGGSCMPTRLHCSNRFIPLFVLMPF